MMCWCGVLCCVCVFNCLACVCFVCLCGCICICVYSHYTLHHLIENHIILKIILSLFPPSETMFEKKSTSPALYDTAGNSVIL